MGHCHFNFRSLIKVSWKKFVANIPNYISKFAVIKKMADVDFTTMLCEPELVMITARTVLFAYINLGINNIYLTNFMVLMLCLFGYLFKI